MAWDLSHLFIFIFSKLGNTEKNPNEANVKTKLGYGKIWMIHRPVNITLINDSMIINSYSIKERGSKINNNQHGLVDVFILTLHNAFSQQTEY